MIRATPSPGAIVPPIEWHEIALEVFRQGPSDLPPRSAAYSAALAWRLAHLVPVVRGPAYAVLWNDPDPRRRTVLLSAVFQAGDLHYDASDKRCRQVMATWLHSNLQKIENVTAERNALAAS